MGSLLDRAEKTIRHHDLLAPDDRVLVALSGGPDCTFCARWDTRRAPRIWII